MSDELSNDPADKLHAARNHDWWDSDKDLPGAYLVACRRWYAGLTGSHRVVVILAAAEFAKGDEVEAEGSAAALPAAPKFPLEE